MSLIQVIYSAIAKNEHSHIGLRPDMTLSRQWLLIALFFKPYVEDHKISTHGSFYSPWREECWWIFHVPSVASSQMITHAPFTSSASGSHNPFLLPSVWSKRWNFQGRNKGSQCLYCYKFLWWSENYVWHCDGEMKSDCNVELMSQRS